MMKAKKTIMAMIVTLAVAVGFAGDSSPFLLDTMTTSTSPVGDSISISWDASWIGGNANATVIIADNGTEVKRATGSGQFTYSLSGTVQHELTYTTYIGGVAQGEVYAVTAYSKYKVSFDANGGSVDESIRYVTPGNVIGTLPTPTWTGYVFTGWWTSASGGAPISSLTTVTSNVTFYAHWTKKVEDDMPEPTPALDQESASMPELWPETAEQASEGQGNVPAVQGEVPVNAASVYDGFFYRDEEIAGTVQVKVAKPKDGKAKATVTFQPVGGKKTTVSGTLDVATGKVAGLDLTLGAEGMSGTWSGYVISGSRNLFASKDKAEQGKADAALKPWLGAVNVAWREAGRDGSPYQTLTVNVAKKGKAKVAGTLASGARVLASGQLIVGAEWCCVPVAWSKKGEKVAFTLWLPMNGQAASSPRVIGLGEDVKVGKPGTLKGGAKFKVDAASVAGLVRGAQEAYLPDGVAVSGGARWSVPKAGSIAYKNGAFDTSKAGENPSGLKLTCKAKDGTFKGSFSAYALDGGKLKKTKVDVTGVLVEGVGYGAATVKKVGSVPITIDTE